MDSDQKLVDEATRASRAAPDTQIWIYRNLVIAYAEFVQVREKLEDPQYAGWFLRFGGNESALPRCDPAGHCSDLFHTPSQRPGGDCGKVPCGWYVFDHRNASLREWLIEEYMLGPRFGLGNASVSGFYLDDWWTLDGPTEVNHFFEGTGLPHYGSEIKELYTNWSFTAWEAERRIAAAGGYTWSNFNCQLDRKPGYGGATEDCPPCGLTKTEGYPHAAPDPLSPVKQMKLSDAKAQCTDWLRVACKPDSILPRIPFLLAFTRNDNGAQFPLPSPLEDVATFLLVRGPYAWMGYGWLGCTDKYERPASLLTDVGEPLESCHEENAGVFVRRWSRKTVTMDCNNYTASIISETVNI
uniref:Uncharacterized protein n=1 Tax=Haptolina ericina TaxID=156174 RepID=A0A7S3FFR1_9EUKA